MIDNTAKTREQVRRLEWEVSPMLGLWILARKKERGKYISLHLESFCELKLIVVSDVCSEFLDVLLSIPSEA